MGEIVIFNYPKPEFHLPQRQGSRCLPSSCLVPFWYRLITRAWKLWIYPNQLECNSRTMNLFKNGIETMDNLHLSCYRRGRRSLPLKRDKHSGIQFESCSAHLRIPRDGDFWKRNILTGGVPRAPLEKVLRDRLGRKGAREHECGKDGEAVGHHRQVIY